MTELTMQNDFEPLTQSQVTNIKSWYAKQNFTDNYIREIQTTVKTEPDAKVGKDTISKVLAYQKKFGLSKDGKFGNECATKAGLTPKTNKLQPKNTSADIKHTTSGKGINPKPLFQKQYNFKTSPYVEKADYNKMATAMNGAAFSSWDINSDKLSKLYQSAYKSNGGKTTIASSGCGITAYANLKGISPLASAEKSMKENGRVYHKGTSAAFFGNNGGSETWSATEALNRVANGKYLICSHGYGNWCKSDGHFILVYGADGNNVYVSDSNSTAPERAQASYATFKKSFKYGYTF